MLSFLLLISLSFAEEYKNCDVEYCKECSTAGTCTQCLENYILKEGQCKFKRDLGCEVFDTQNNICKQCADGYKMDTKAPKCEEGEEKCNVYKINQNFLNYPQQYLICDECKNPYVLNSQKECVDCSAEIEHCAEYTLNGNNECGCKSCSQGYVFNKEGQCQLVDEFCMYPNVEGGSYQCRRCYPGYFIDATGLCEKGEVENCWLYESLISYDDEGPQNGKRCLYCVNQIPAIDGKCPICTMENCAGCIEEDGEKICKKCNEGYYMTTEKKCAKCDDGCAECSDFLGICTKCEDDEFLVNEKGICEEWSTANPGCKDYDIYNGCGDCDEGYVNVFDSEIGKYICKSCGEHCSSCYEEGNCRYCESGYYEDSSNGKTICKSCGDNCESCSEGNYCDRCQENYFRYFGSNNECICKPCGDGCNYCDEFRGCEYCEDNFYLDTSNGNRMCKSCGEACYYCDEDYGCEYCESGYYVDTSSGKGICKECGEHCRSCNDVEDCTTCESEYYVDTSSEKRICKKCGEHCDYCNNVEDCTRCGSGYYVDTSSGKGICKECGEYCDYCNDAEDCTRCESEYYLDTSSGKGICKGCPGGCYCYDNQGCASCQYGYYESYDSNGALSCKECPDNCDYCDNENTCTICESGYYSGGANKAICEKCPDYCYCENNKGCTSCEDGYHLVEDSNGIVTCEENAVVANCAGYDDEGKCSSCKGGFTLDSGNNACISNNGCKSFYNVANKICSECENGYFMKNDYTCGKCDEECGKCIHEADECLSYENVEHPHCLFVGKDHKCSKCEERYEVKEGECVLVVEFKKCVDTSITPKGKCTICQSIIEDKENPNYGEIVYYDADENGVCGNPPSPSDPESDPEKDPESDPEKDPESKPDSGSESILIMMILIIIALVF